MSSVVKNNDQSSPRLWIRRLVVFDSQMNKSAPFRNVPFHRGLNIVWGVELPDDAGASGGEPVTLSGHSVGKTTLCRLIRYCLGEPSFGNPGAMSRIRYAFPDGWVGMELTLDNQEWAVLKPIGHSGNSMAGQSICVEDLFDQNQRENQYRQFIDRLEDFILPELPANSPPNADKPYEWRHLLAWLTRDQEARFQSLHDWRSPRSGKDTAKFQRPKEHALYLIRLVLVLVQEKELEMSSALADLERELKERETRIEDLRQQPEYRLRDQEEALKMLLDLPLGAVLNADPSDLTSPVVIRRMDINNAIMAAQEEIQKIDLRIAQKRIWLASYDEQERFFRDALDATKEGTELPQGQEEEDDTIRKLRELRGRDCDYGDVPFLECLHVKDRLAKAEKVIDLQKVREERRVASETDLRLSILKQQRKDHEQIVSLLNELREKLAKDISEKNQRETELARCREGLRRIEYHLEERQRALVLIDGRTPNTPLQEEMSRAAKLRETIQQRKQELESLDVLYKDRLTAIRGVYDGLVKRALSDTYSGVLQMPRGEIQFCIEEATGLAGEAVETLSLVLADVAAMVCSCQGIGHHPRFLLHDCPREADLDRHIYNRFLRAMWALTEDFGGREAAPFQYIVTTTTRPPGDLGEAICLQLEAHPEDKMLFGRLLRNRPTDDQLSVFS